MPNTYVALKTETVAVATSSVTLSLSGISGYTDLVLVINATASGGALNPQIQFNGDTASNYSLTWMYGNGSAPFSNRYSSQTSSYIGYLTTTEPATFIVQVQNYSNSTTNKTALFRWNTANAEAGAGVCLWRSTAAITSVTVKTSANNFAVGSTFNLYGIANADQGAAKATGGIITEDSQYWYHTFGASGAFIPKQSLTCDVLVVAGGGGAGSDGAGGGGAGGLLAFTSQSLTATSYNVTVGAGGPGGTSGTAGTVGVDSQFAALTLVKGGGYGARADVGGNGGSGGGGSGRGKVTGNNPAGGSPTSSQGFAGGAGAGSSGSGQAGGGGGGAGAVGAAAAISVSGNGGVGSSTYSSWSIPTGIGQNVSGTYFLAGGGGGSYEGSGSLGTGGNGGGGTARSGAVGTAGTPNTGGGGGASLTGYSAGAGGSGVVIIRYSK